MQSLPNQKKPKKPKKLKEPLKRHTKSIKKTSVFITSYTTKLFFCKIPLSLHQLSLSLH